MSDQHPVEGKDWLDKGRAGNLRHAAVAHHALREKLADQAMAFIDPTGLALARADDGSGAIGAEYFRHAMPCSRSAADMLRAAPIRLSARGMMVIMEPPAGR